MILGPAAGYCGAMAPGASLWLISHWTGPFGPAQQEKHMKKSWTKPTMCEVPAGLEISRYLPARMTPRK